MSNPNPDTPFPGTFWVIPQILLAGAYPGGTNKATTEQRMKALLDCGIHSVINLMAEEEMQEIESGDHYIPYEDVLEAMGEERGIVVEIARYAIEDGNTLTEQEMELILDAIDAEIDGRDSPTLVHCSNGNGRTGMVIGCYLARHGIAHGKEALAKIRELRATDEILCKHKSPETMTEEKFVLRWKAER
ncbi:MAG TPA: tyrosine-protein phosphatase [Candidatus Binatia bacterium]|nr:tyrosine-protein phosphatase [Candidatus Binatia bacterium]